MLRYIEKILITGLYFSVMPKFTYIHKNIIIFISISFIIGIILDIFFVPCIVEYITNYIDLKKFDFYITGIGITILPGFLGVYLGFYTDKWKEYNKLQENVEKILPLMEIELRWNLKSLEKYPLINIAKDKNVYFRTSYWEMYKSELSRWAFINIVSLTEIYGLIYSFNQYNCSLYSEMIKSNIRYLLKEYDKWYSDKANELATKSARDSKREVIKQYKEIPNIGENMNEIIIGIEKRLNEIQDELEEKY